MKVDGGLTIHYGRPAAESRRDHGQPTDCLAATGPWARPAGPKPDHSTLENARRFPHLTAECNQQQNAGLELVLHKQNGRFQKAPGAESLLSQNYSGNPFMVAGRAADMVIGPVPMFLLQSPAYCSRHCTLII